MNLLTKTILYFGIFFITSASVIIFYINEITSNDLERQSTGNLDIIIGGGVFVVIGTIFSVFFIRKLLIRIEEIINVTKLVTEGNFYVRANEQNIDEIGTFSKMLNIVFSSIQDGQKNILNMKNKSEADKIESRKLQTIISSVLQGIILIDTDYTIVLVNPKASEFFMMPQKDIIGKDIRYIIKLWKGNAELPFDMWPIKEMFLKKSAVITHLQDNLFLTTAARESRLPVELHVSPFEGGVSGGIIVISDITADHELDEAKSGFISIASHQLRTPLTAIKNFTELLSKPIVGDLNERQKRYVDDAYHSVKRMIILVNDLLNVSRIESGKLRISPEDTDLIDFVQVIIDELKPFAESKKCNIIFNKPRDVMPNIGIDRSLVRQVIHNLITNAVRYSPESSPDVIIAIERDNGFNTESDGGVVIISVKDNGIGIPKEVQSHIFEKFFRADNAIKKEAEGSGIGMYIAKMIMETSGGGLSFSSPPEGEETGSVFRVVLPVKGMIKKDGEKGLIGETE